MKPHITTLFSMIKPTVIKLHRQKVYPLRYFQTTTTLHIIIGQIIISYCLGENGITGFPSISLFPCFNITKPVKMMILFVMRANNVNLHYLLFEVFTILVPELQCRSASTFISHILRSENR